MSVQIIKKYLKEMAEQNNQMTGFPYMFLLQGNRDGGTEVHSMFFTQSDAERALANEKYSMESAGIKNPHLYIKHCHGAEDMKMFFKVLYDFFEMKHPDLHFDHDAAFEKMFGGEEK